MARVSTAIIVVLFGLLLPREVASVIKCDELKDCNECRMATSCFWCPQNSDGRCMNFFNRNIANLLCNNPDWETYRCQDKSLRSQAVNKILDIIVRLEKLKRLKQENAVRTTPSSPEARATIPSANNEVSLPPLVEDKLSKELAELKAFLAEGQKQETASEIENELEKSVVSTSAPIIRTLSLEQELSKDVDNFVMQTEQTTPKINTPNSETSTQNAETNTQNVETTLATTTTSQAPPETPPKPTQNIDWEDEFHSENASPKLVTNDGCGTIMSEFSCNVELNCSWCHINEKCVGRNEAELRECFHNDKRVIEEDFGIDPCMHHVTCGTCTSTQGKCYWCEHTKSCHIYPFFGFVPHTCPTNHWYYKQCNVQFALLLFMFPLLLVLISMLVFYFCLRYCFYRKRLVKVPLFDKVPGSIYEKKKGKKIYFMSGEEDEDSRAEKIRKKYQLPLEKEPLIAP